jgi:hypothetical protein
MGHESKIDSSSEERSLAGHRSSLFFRDAQRGAEKPNLYSLEAEFAKTKKQKNILFYTGFLFFIIALVVLTFVITESYQRRSSEIKIDVSDFRDLHLADVLQHFRKDETSLRRLRREISDLRNTQRTERQKIFARFASEREILALKYMSAEEREEAAALLDTEERTALAAIDARFVREIGQREREIGEIQKRLAVFTQEYGDEAAGADIAAESALQVRELESRRLDENWQRRVEDEQSRYARAQEENRVLLQRMTDSLILRYNPIFREQNLVALFPPEDVHAIPALPQFSSFSSFLTREVTTANAAFSEVQRNAQEGRMLLTRIYETGYTNSIAPALLALAIRENALIAGYERLWRDIERRFAFRNSQKQALMHTLDLLIQNNKVQGYIVDTGDPGRMLAVISSRLNLAEWKGANIIRSRDNRRIGNVTFEQTPDGLFAIPTEPFTHPAEPMDRIQLIK